MPSSNLPQHLGQLLESHAGADVTFAVSGESFAAHKSILAARSPVFRAEFFGEIFFFENTGELRFFVLERRKKGPIQSQLSYRDQI